MDGKWTDADCDINITQAYLHTYHVNVHILYVTDDTLYLSCTFNVYKLCNVSAEGWTPKKTHGVRPTLSPKA